MSIHRWMFSWFVVVMAVIGSTAVGGREVHAARVEWTGGGDGVSWTDPKNWSTGKVPGGADDVFIPETAKTVVVSGSTEIQIKSLDCRALLRVESQERFIVNGSASVHSLFMTGFSVEFVGEHVPFEGFRGEVIINNLTLQQGGVTFHVAATLDSVSMSGGALFEGTGSLSIPGQGVTVNGLFRWEGGQISQSSPNCCGVFLNGNMVIDGTAAKVLFNGELVNRGTMSWSGGPIETSGTNIRNLGTFTIKTDNILGPDSRVFNEGVVEKLAGIGTTTLGEFNNLGGTLRVDTGTVELRQPEAGGFTGGIWEDGTAKIAEGASLIFIGTHTLKGDTTLEASGRVQVQVGRIPVGSLINEGTLRLDKVASFTLDDVSALLNASTGTLFASGRIEGSAGTVVNQGSFHIGTSPGSLIIEGTFDQQSSLGVLHVELGGVRPGVDQDILEVGTRPGWVGLCASVCSAASARSRGMASLS